MIIGDGLLANSFNQYQIDKNIIIFASGVSNSNEREERNFKREEELLNNTIIKNPGKIIVYFSSCDVVYADEINTPYYYHKLNMENIIKGYAEKYYIFRLPQVIGNSTNNDSLINYFITSILNGKNINIWKNAYKNLIDIEDIMIRVKNIINNHEHQNKTINIINTNYYSVLEIVETIEELLNIKAKINLIDKGFQPSYLDNYPEDEQIKFDENYLMKSLKKHYAELVIK